MRTKRLERLTERLYQTVHDRNNNPVFRPYRFCESCNSVTNKLGEISLYGGGTFLHGPVYMHLKCNQEVSNDFGRLPRPVQSKLKRLNGHKHQTELFFVALEKCLRAVNAESDLRLNRFLRNRVVADLALAPAKR